MTLSFGLSKRVIENTLYNISVSLPFICAFYILNTTAIVTVPFTNIPIQYELARLVEIFEIVFVYYFFVFCFIWFGSISLIYGKSRLSATCAIILAASGIYSFFKQDHTPKVFVFYSIVCLIYVFIIKVCNSKESNGSLLAIQMCGSVLSLLCFVTGLLWFENCLLFKDFISYIMGLQVINQESIKVGAVMLVTIGYVVLFSIFKGTEMWTCLATKNADKTLGDT